MDLEGLIIFLCRALCLSATLFTMFAVIIFIGVIDPPELFSKIGAVVLIAWAGFSGVITTLSIKP